MRGDEKHSQSIPVAGWLGHFDFDLRFLPSLSLAEEKKGPANDPGHFRFTFLLYRCSVDRFTPLCMGAAESLR
jgi:hypothetical protein